MVLEPPGLGQLWGPHQASWWQHRPGTLTQWLVSMPGRCAASEQGERCSSPSLRCLGAAQRLFSEVEEGVGGLRGLPTPVIKEGGQPSTAARDTVPAGSRRQSQALHVEQAKYLLSVPGSAGLCFGKRHFNPPAASWTGAAWSRATWSQVPGRSTREDALPTICGVQKPFPALRQDPGAAGRGAGCDVLSLADVSALSQAAGKRSHGWGN